MEKWEIRPPLPEKPLNRSSPKFAWVIMLGTQTSVQNFITIRLPLFAPQICENSHQVTWLVLRGEFSDSLQPRPLNQFLQSLHQMTSFRERMCIFGVPNTKFYISTQFLAKKTEILSQFLTGQNFASKSRCSPINGNFEENWKFTLNRHRSLMKVV